MLELNNMKFRYNTQSPLLIDNLSFTAEQGDIIAIKGRSGSGKTTLLNLICGVIPKIFSGDLSGSVHYNNINIAALTLPEVAPRISLLMQNPDNQLFFPTVEQELAFAPENCKIEPEDIFKRIDSVLVQLDITNLRYEETTSLSFGQKKLVTLASIITLSPEVYLLDEPFSGLSKKYINLVSKIIKEQSVNSKIIFIAGHSNNVMQFANKTIKLGI